MDVAVIGLGLIGGSIMRSLHAAGGSVIGYSRSPETRAEAARAGLRVADTTERAVRDADLTIVAVPLPAVGAVFDQLAALGYSGTVTDVTSVKGPVGRLAERLPPTAAFVGGHPMAGKETSGFAASDAALLSGCAWVLCLEPASTPLPTWLDLARLVTGLGARAVPSTAADHDQAVALISHVPHLLAVALAAAAGHCPAALTLAAGSFRDGTRVAATRPELTAAMCGGNAAAVSGALAAVLAELDPARKALASADPVSQLLPVLEVGHQVRSRWPGPRCGDPIVVPARAETLTDLGAAGGWVVAVRNR